MRKMFAVCLVLCLCVPSAIAKCVPLEITETELGEIAGKLFNMSPDDTNYDYNWYGCCPDPNNDGVTYCDERRSGYHGGHSGWDTQTKSVERGNKPADERFYSLTAGKVIKTGGKYGTIAVYNCEDDKTTLYLHARRIYVSEGLFVKVGTPLGIQGNKGLNDANPNDRVHVHVEVRKGRTEYSSLGAEDTRTIDPIRDLYEWIKSERGKYLPVDVDRDGLVDISDYLSVWILWQWAWYIPQYDIDCDGMINGKDLDLIWEHWTVSSTLAAPVAHAPLVGQTRLHPNYPNPFNPETWIPYSLAEDADVKLTIYDIQGTEVRRFDLGQQPAGHYTDRRKSIYWDGRNKLGEQVVGGVYFYHLQAGNYSATRRMTILK